MFNAQLPDRKKPKFDISLGGSKEHDNNILDKIRQSDIVLGYRVLRPSSIFNVISTIFSKTYF